jgi:hypothetical protein
MTDQTLERLLALTAESVEYPATPDLRAAVVSRAARVDAAGVRRGWRPSFALAAVLIAVLVAAFAVAPSREAIGRFFGVEGSKIEVQPTALPGSTATQLPPVPAGAYQGLRPVALEELRGMMPFRVAVPDTGQTLRQSYFVSYGNQPVAVLSYEAFDLWQTQLRQEAFFAKGIPQDAILIETEVDGETATWLSGPPHMVTYYAGPNQAIQQSLRTVERSTLIWRTNAAFYRIETDLPMEDAIRIAETLP